MTATYEAAMERLQLVLDHPRGHQSPTKERPRPGQGRHRRRR